MKEHAGRSLFSRSKREVWQNAASCTDRCHAMGFAQPATWKVPSWILVLISLLIASLAGDNSTVGLGQIFGVAIVESRFLSQNPGTFLGLDMMEFVVAVFSSKRTAGHKIQTNNARSRP